MLALGGGSDALERVAACLQWEDLAAITRCCRATRDSVTSQFYRAWAARSALVLPPDAGASHTILSTVTSVNTLVIPHSHWLDRVLADKALAPRLACVHRLTVDPDRFLLDGRHPLNLHYLAQVFPSTTRLTFQRVNDVKDIEALYVFRCVRCLELFTTGSYFSHAIDMTAFPLLEELRMQSVNYEMIQSLESVTNLQAYELTNFGTLRDLTQWKHLSQLTKLGLSHMTVGTAAVNDLLEMAPRLTRFECRSIQSVWCDADTPVDGVDAERLALAFSQLKTLILRDIRVQDLPSLSLIDSLRDLTLGVRVQSTTELRPLLQLVRLQRLKLQTENAIAIEMFTALPQLESLNYSHYQWSPGRCDESVSITGAHTQDHEWQQSRTQAPRLRTLELYLYCCGDTSGLHALFPHLRHLSITTKEWKSRATVLSDISRLHKLESLHLEAEYMPLDIDFNQLAPLRTLRKLDLRECEIKTLDGIEHLPSLRELQLLLSSYPILTAVDLSAFECLQHLQVLRIPRCSIEDVSPLTRMLSLRVVELPKQLDCLPLVVAYHAARLRLPGAPASIDLQQVKHGDKLCLWGSHYHSERVQAHLRAMVGDESQQLHGIDCSGSPGSGSDEEP